MESCVNHAIMESPCKSCNNSTQWHLLLSMLLFYSHRALYAIKFHKNLKHLSRECKSSTFQWYITATVHQCVNNKLHIHWKIMSSFTRYFCHWLTIKMTTFGEGIDKYFVRMTTFLFPWSEGVGRIVFEHQKASWNICLFWSVYDMWYMILMTRYVYILGLEMNRNHKSTRCPICSI